MTLKLGDNTQNKVPDCEHRPDALLMPVFEALQYFSVRVKANGNAYYLYCNECKKQALNAIPSKFANNYKNN